MSARQPRYHIWNVDDRSLCDLFARTQVVAAPEGEHLSPCGPCVLVAEELMARAKGLVYEHGAPAPEPRAAADELAGGRWGRPEIVDHLKSQFDKINYRYPWFKDRELGDGEHHDHVNA